MNHATASLPRARMHAASTPRFVRFLAIAVVFAMGAAFALPTPAAAQVASEVSGRVLDSEGEPIADAEVSIKKRINGSLWSYHETQSGKDGSFAFSGLEPGTWTLRALKEGFRSNQTEVTTSAGADQDIDIVLVSLTERIYTGKILDSETQAPIGGATITTTGYSGGNHTERSTTSQQDGTFSLLLFASENQVTVTKSGYSTFRDWVWQPNGVVERTISLYPVPPQTATVTGKVVDAAGNPVKAYVTLYPDYSGDCCIAYDDGGSGETRSITSDSPASYSPYYYDNHNNTVTDDDGTFTMKAYPGAVTLQANRVSYLVASERVTLEDGKTTTITFTLVKLPERTVTISGTVTDKSTGDPVQGAGISVQVPAMGDHAWAQSDADGKFSVKVRPGYTLVEASHWGHCCIEVAYATDSEGGSADVAAPEPHPGSGSTKRYHPVNLVFTTSEGETKTLDLGLTAKADPTGTLVGYVLDAATGKAIAGAHVSLQNHDTGEWGQATTDENGSYKFNAYGGYHSVRIWRDGYLPSTMNVVVPEEGAKRADFEIHAGEHSNEGWWDPDGKDGEEVYPGPRPMSADSEGTYKGDAEMSIGARGPLMVSDSDDRAATSEPEGAQSYSGSGGGLPAYDASKKGDTFGAGETAESPVSPIMVLVLALGALAVVAGMRRER